jgi:uncharacterized protein (TIGR03083 family)
MDLFAAIALERGHLADLLDGLTDAQWTTESCCTGWTVEDVAAHTTVVWNYSSADYVKAGLKNRSTWFRPRKRSRRSISRHSTSAERSGARR